MGYGLIAVDRSGVGVVDHGFFRVDGPGDFSERLKKIHDTVTDLLDRHRPDVVVVEEVYVSRNAKTTLKLGHARGVILLAAVEGGFPVAEYAPREIRQAVLGAGGASKRQVQWMMAQMLHLSSENLQEDAADGLAAALCHGLRSCGSEFKLRVESS